MKPLKLKGHGKIVAQSETMIVYSYQEQNVRMRVFYYMVTLRGQRECNPLRLNKVQQKDYISQIKRENGNIKRI
jgi:hypothetical protein